MSDGKDSRLNFPKTHGIGPPKIFVPTKYFLLDSVILRRGEMFNFKWHVE